MDTLIQDIRYGLKQLWRSKGVTIVAIMSLADGRVTEHQYNAAGEIVTTFRYASALYTSSPFTLAALDSWANTQRGLTVERLDYTYDFRGNTSTITTWSGTTGAGGAGAGTAHAGQPCEHRPLSVDEVERSLDLAQRSMAALDANHYLETLDHG